MSSENNDIKVSVLNLDGVVYEGTIKALTSHNVSGKFDVLPYHAPFISIITTEIILHETSGSVKTIPIEKAVLEVEDNVVTVFMGIEAVY